MDIVDGTKDTISLMTLVPLDYPSVDCVANSVIRRHRIDVAKDVFVALLQVPGAHELNPQLQAKRAVSLADALINELFD